MVPARSFHALCSSATMRLLEQSYHLVPCPVTRDHFFPAYIPQRLRKRGSMFAFPPSVFRRLIWLTLMSVAAGSVTVEQASASLIWDWNYSRAGVVAGGTFTTNDTPDGGGFYLITDITGTRNGETITGLQPTGTPIPGNEPFAVDNLV